MKALNLSLTGKNDDPWSHMIGLNLVVPEILGPVLSLFLHIYSKAVMQKATILINFPRTCMVGTSV